MKIMIYDQMLHQSTILAAVLTTQIFPWFQIFTKNIIIYDLVMCIFSNMGT